MREAAFEYACAIAGVAVAVLLTLVLGLGGGPAAVSGAMGAIVGFSTGGTVADRRKR